MCRPARFVTSVFVQGAQADRYAGYGQSSKPRAEANGNHVEYSKRTMATDVVSLMTSLGHSTFKVLAHDRGARVAHRLALDHPDKVEKMVLLDIAPTLWMYEHTDMAFVSHWLECVTVMGDIPRASLTRRGI